VPCLEALGLVARQLGFAVAVFETLDRHGDEIAGLDLDLALVVLEFLDRNEALGLEARVDDHDVEVDADDLAVMSSPWRISCRVRDSSNSAAKFSIGAELPEAMLEMAVAIGVGSFISQAAVSENPVSRAAGGLSNPSGAPAKALADGPAFADRLRCRSVHRCPACAAVSAFQRAVARERRSDGGVDRHAGRYPGHGVSRGAKGRRPGWRRARRAPGYRRKRLSMYRRFLFRSTAYNAASPRSSGSPSGTP
jgi:hypothetical protein